MRLPPFQRLLEEHGEDVLRYLRAAVGRQDADDCWQETMLAALRAYDELREESATRSWLFAIAARKALDAHRSSARAPEPVADLDPPAADDAMPLRDEGVWHLVRSLPGKQRSAVTLRYLADLTHREIAEVMQTSEESARRNVFEGLRRLREHREEGMT